MALTAKQQRFVEAYLVSLNAADAAREAGYSENTAKQIGHELLGKPDVAAAIAEAQAVRADRMQISQDDVLRRVAAIAFADIGCFASWGEDGELVMVASGDVERDALPALREVRSTTSTVTFKDGGERTSVYKAVKLHDPLRALELLGKHLGMFKEQIEVDHRGLADMFELVRRQARGDEEA